MIVTPRPSATLVLMRDRDPEKGQPEVLLVRRPEKAAFGPGAYVFPGGAMEPKDYTERMLGRSVGRSPEEAHTLLKCREPTEQALGFFVAAIRETFEETGVLLARHADGSPAGTRDADPEPLRAGREALLRGQADFSQWLISQDLYPDTERLVYFAHWITPEPLPIRFDTRFFLAEAPAAAQVVIDPRELVTHRWLSPAEAIALSHEGKIELMDPTWRNLELLATFTSTGQALRELGHREIQAVMAKIVIKPDGGPTLVYPWDPKYDRH